MTLLRLLLVVLATLRATRFVTSDHLGEWWLVGPAKNWAYQREARAHEIDGCERTAAEVAQFAASALGRGEALPSPPPSWGWRSKLVKGLDCPFCVGFWIAALALLAEVATRRVPVLRGLWSFVAGVGAINYVTGHVSSRIDG